MTRDRIRRALGVLGGVLAISAASHAQELVLYEREGLAGAALPLTREVSNFSDVRFNDTARSLVAQGTWEVCSDARFSGKCTVVEGRVDNLTAIGFGANISSARPVRGGTNRVGITLYPEPDFRGEPRQFVRDTANLNALGFNDRAMSVQISGGDWTLCEDADYDGRCVSIRSDVRDLSAIGMGRKLSSMRTGRFDRDGRGGGRGGRGAPAVTLYDQPGFAGQGIELLNAETDLNRYNFNDKARSMKVTGRWIVCEHNAYEGRCELIDGDVDDLARLSLAGRVSSLRPAERGETSGWGGTGSGSGWGSGGDARADAVGTSSAFFKRPTSRGLPIDQCVDSSGRNCGPEAADRFCRSVGYRQAAYSIPSRTRVQTVHIGDGQRCLGQCAPIEDVLCIR